MNSLQAAPLCGGRPADTVSIWPGTTSMLCGFYVSWPLPIQIKVALYGPWCPSKPDAIGPRVGRHLGPRAYSLQALERRQSKRLRERKCHPRRNQETAYGLWGGCHRRRSWSMMIA